MGLAIFMGLVLALTPFVADKFFPTPENSVRQAKPEAAAMALKRWFQSPDAQFVAVQAINKKTPITENRHGAFPDKIHETCVSSGWQSIACKV